MPKTQPFEVGYRITRRWRFGTSEKIGLCGENGGAHQDSRCGNGKRRRRRQESGKLRSNRSGAFSPIRNPGIRVTRGTKFASRRGVAGHVGTNVRRPTLFCRKTGPQFSRWKNFKLPECRRGQHEEKVGGLIEAALPAERARDRAGIPISDLPTPIFASAACELRQGSLDGIPPSKPSLPIKKGPRHAVFTV